MAYGSYVLQHDLSFKVNSILVVMGGGCQEPHAPIWIGPRRPGERLSVAINFWDRTGTRDRIMRRFGVLYQSGALWSSITLAENVALSLELYTDLKPASIRSAH